MHNIHRVCGFALLLVLWSSSLVMGSNARLTEMGPDVRPESPVDTYHEAVDGFNLLSSFFNDTEGSDIYPISRHGGTYSEAYQYLMEGFDSPLAADILSAYTFTDHQGTLRIIPCEGIPCLTAAHREKAIVTRHLHSTLIVVPLTDCYQPGDRYIYQVALRWVDGQWKISDLSLIPE